MTMRVNGMLSDGLAADNAAAVSQGNWNVKLFLILNPFKEVLIMSSNSKFSSRMTKCTIAEISNIRV